MKIKPFFNFLNKLVVLCLFVLIPTCFAYSSEMLHKHAHHTLSKPCASESVVKIDLHKISDQQGKKIIQFKLTNLKTGQPITLEDLIEVHTRKIHLLVVDDSLEDYSHVHPRALKQPGLYVFECKPLKSGKYLIWADLVLKSPKGQVYAGTELILGPRTTGSDKSTINRVVVFENKKENYLFNLYLEPKQLSSDKAAMGRLEVSDLRTGSKVKDLEPIMGAFGHIVGFTDDLKTVLHIHPLGKEPKNLADRGGPNLLFHIEPMKKGFTKLFAQVKIKGQELIVPFGLIVK